MKHMIHTPRLKDIRITDELFGHYASLVADQILPYQWRILNDQVPGAAPSHCIENFRIAAGSQKGTHQGPVFIDTDAYKWLEALAYCLENQQALSYEPIADELIELIGQAQQTDGYLDTYFSISHPEQRWSNLAEGHELYCAGHLIEAGTAYYQAVGKDHLLKIAMRFADLICDIFLTGGREGYPGHQEIELALIKLFHVCGDEKYLKLAQHFLNERGKEPNYLMQELERTGKARIFPEFKDYDAPYAQSQAQPWEQKTAEGHAVRAMYMFAAMADAAMESDDEKMKAGCQTLWNNVTEHRMYVTGGVGSSGYLERFTTDYDLPNDRMYCESCASVGLMMFGQRMAALMRDAGYYDVVERALCNTVLAGISCEGDRYFYVNPLEVWPQNCLPGTSLAHVKAVRQPWYDVACCPTNIARTLASLGQYIYAEDDDSIFINQWISSTLTTEIAGQVVHIRLENDLMRKGKMWITLDVAADSGPKLYIRIPPYLSDVQFDCDEKRFTPHLEKGYALVDFHTLPVNAGSCHKLTVKADMEPHFTAANTQVRADIGCMALQYGPFMYCLEQVDNGANLSSLYVSPDTEIRLTEPIKGLPGKLPALFLAGKSLNSGVMGMLYGTPAFSLIDRQLKAVPYALWGNRQPGEMLVWLKVLL